MEISAPLSNTMYDILKVMGKDAEFLYDTIDAFIEDAKMEINKNSLRCGKKSLTD